MNLSLEWARDYVNLDGITPKEYCDRLTATEMGVAAVELLLKGRSDLVICEIDGKIVPVDINFALILDRMYKNKLKDGDLDAFTISEIEEMRAICKERHDEIKHLYTMSQSICK